ncbi:Hypothetical protein SMAX5B_013551 [Scophthalmus maximus]|uniref:Uncharacterized protein n=1 Tax=Scophthalmus maximus TaxID=52904 RepID=A0A2U9AWR7_SCOMX|nr:Hypothetical protein SMAX5B_013551 [Scophthalmus maximus]
MFPPLCQILKDLCPSPGRCSVCQGQIQSSVTTAFGIMAGFFSIGLGPGCFSTDPGDLTSLGAAYWLGAVQIFSSQLGFTVFMNIAGAILAIAGIMLYTIDLRDASVLSMCDQSTNSVDPYDDKCSDMRLLKSMDVSLVARTFLQLFVNIRFAIIGIKALTSEMKEEKDDQDVDDQQAKSRERFILISLRVLVP